MPPVRTHAKPAFLTGRPRVQTQWVWGRNERRRWAIFAVKFSIFLGLPWLTVGGSPALLFDLPQRQFHAFGQIFWPQDFYMLGLLLALAALLLITTTSLVGRVFCGHACPHTLLQNLFMVIDHWVEGDRPTRLAMDADLFKKPEWVARRVLKHAIWVAIAGWMGLTFVSYFVGMHELLHRVATFTFGGAALAGWLAVSTVTYLFAGHLRDWVCMTVCPYGRFQGALQDDESLIVTYDAVRGEPRGKTKEVRERAGCVDCTMCVTVCPMGIDIRQGYQYECITCARCVDACDATMGKLGAPGGLIRFASLQEYQAHQEEPAKPMPPIEEHRFWRPRLAMYAAVLVGIVGALAAMLLTRPLLGLEVMRDRTHVSAMADGRVANLYTLKLLNKDTEPRRVEIRVEGLDAQLLMGENPLTIAPGDLRAMNASVVVASRKSASPAPFSFRLIDLDTGKPLDTDKATFVTDTSVSRAR